MAVVNPGRMTHHHEGELVVFLIGMRVNQWWRVRQWWPVFQAMPPMLAELSRDKDSGLLGYRTLIGREGPLIIQYWSSHEQLYAYAADPAAAHRPAWSAFNRLSRRAAGAVGIWHETYLVDRAESIYSGMPTTGLAAATHLVPVGRRLDTARQRLVATTDGGRAGPSRLPGAETGRSATAQRLP